MANIWVKINMKYDGCKIVLNSYYSYCIFGEDMFLNPKRLIQYFIDNNIQAAVQSKEGIVYMVEIRD